MVSQIIKIVGINAFIGWRIYEKRQFLDSADIFGSLDSFRHQLNSVQCINPFMIDSGIELLSYPCNLTAGDYGSAPPENIEVRQSTNSSKVPTEEIERLSRLSKERKSKRLTFFNSADGVKLRIVANGDEPRQGNSLYCALCGKNCSPRREHRSSYHCCLCATNLCLKIHTWLRKSC